MLKLNKSQTEWLQNIYNTSFRLSGDNQFSLRLAAKLYQDSRLNPNFELPDGSGAGIAALPTDTEGVDVTNPQEAVEYVATKALDQFIASDGDLNSITETSEDISNIESAFDQELFGSNTTFTDIENKDNRFKKSMRDPSTDGLKSLVGEMIGERVQQRNKVLS